MEMDRIIELRAITNLLYEKKQIKGLMFGDMGVSLICHSLFQITGDACLEKQCIEIANQYLPSEIDDTDFAVYFATSFACGFTGIYSALSILAEEGVGDENLRLLDLDVFEEYIYEHILASTIHSDWSLLHGVTGQLYYLTCCRELTNAMKISLLSHVSSVFGCTDAIEPFRKEKGDLNVSWTHGVTGFLMTIWRCYKSLVTGLDQTRTVLLNLLSRLQDYIAVRLNTADFDGLDVMTLKKDLMVCACLTNLAFESGLSLQRMGEILAYAEILLKTFANNPLYTMNLGQDSGLSGVIECIRTLYKYANTKNFSVWFDYYHDILCQRFLDLDSEKYISNGTLLNGSCGVLLTILHPKIEEDPAWRKLFLY